MIWFTSDQHYFHRNVIKYCNRPFYAGLWDKLRHKATGNVSDKAVAVMNEELIGRHNVLVKPGDTVYHLGDFSLWKHGPREILHRLNGVHHLIAGNHDWCHPTTGKKNLLHYLEAYKAAGFESIKLEDIISIGGHRVTLSHMPFKTDYGDQRYPDWRPKDEGQILLHGHVHQHWKTRGRMINVGVDVWSYAPVSYDEILFEIALMKTQRVY